MYQRFVQFSNFMLRNINVLLSTNVKCHYLYLAYNDGKIQTLFLTCIWYLPQYMIKYCPITSII